MSKFSEYIGSQFGNPRGLIGKICCIGMNIINKPMYRNTVAQMNFDKGDKILDIGYGNGFLLYVILSILVDTLNSYKEDSYAAIGRAA